MDKRVESECNQIKDQADRIHVMLLGEAAKGIADITALRVKDARQCLCDLKIRRNLD
jgi:hypothetical protein